MRALIDLFWSKYADLKRAIDSEDEAQTAALDRELDPLMLAIFGAEQQDTVNIQAQFRFAIDLLNEEADDRSCVRRNAHLLQTLVERYLAPQTLAPPGADGDETGLPEIDGDPTVDGVLDDSLLNQLSDRIFIVAPSYRILYSNEVNARRLDVPRDDLLGRHLAELVGLHRFRNEFKANLDQCFAGETTAVTYADQVNGETIVMRCRMSPFWRSTTLVGALIVIQETADRRKRSAA